MGGDLNTPLIKQESRIADNLDAVFRLALGQENLTAALKALELQIKWQETLTKMGGKRTPSAVPLHEWSDEELEEALKEC